MPGGFVLDGSLAEWQHVPRLRTEGEPGTPKEEAIWAAQSNDGIVVAGHVPSSRLRGLQMGPAGATTLPLIEIWLSVVGSLEFPEIKYRAEACAAPGVDAHQKDACIQWRSDQAAFRERLQRQFIRMWRLSPTGAQEAYALPAFDGLTEVQRKALKFPRPEGLPNQKFKTLADGSVNFEALIPWELFPPADRVSMDRLGLAVKVLERGTTAGETDRADIPSIAVTPSITARVTTCGQPLVGRNLHGEDKPAFYFLTHSREIESAFIFQNPEIPYDTMLPKEGEVSPIASYQDFFAQELDKGEFLCGPFMSYRKGAVTRHYPFRLEPPEDQVSSMKLRPFPVRRLPDGSRLIQYGPDQSHGPLWRRGYAAYSLVLYVLTPSLDTYEALNLGAWSDNGRGYEVEVSGDGRIVKEFRQSIEGAWTAQSFCLASHTYRSCGQDPKSLPPRKRVLTPDE
ncbi:hypothetical protein [Paludibaculum fermentans]|uniref:hypothetical protein n=1 Tax=Paludibaculum fermentans TaxID=1473598 RepID=UPI003EC0A981